MKILVTGGAGYIGSHTVVELISESYEPIIVDNLSNSKASVLQRIENITGVAVPLTVADLCDEQALEKVFAENDIETVIHFAGLKAVGESVNKPLEYYTNNLLSTLTLCKVMAGHGVNNLIFSSSATVYGISETVPINEEAPICSTNPYGQTKVMIEQILKDFVYANPDVRATCLRYFNPVGAHESGEIGEDPSGIPNNLMPYIAQVAVGNLDKVSVYGNDYPTKDGTGVRDYIHVCDLAKGHIAAMRGIQHGNRWEAYNLGTGNGHSVLEAIATFEKVSGKKIPYEIVKRREGDVAECFADPAKAREQLDWAAVKTFEEACGDAWQWQSGNFS